MQSMPGAWETFRPSTGNLLGSPRREKKVSTIGHVLDATVSTITSPVPNEKGAHPPWRPPKTTPYDYHRYADEYWDEYRGCLVEDQEDDIPYVESDDDG